MANTKVITTISLDAGGVAVLIAALEVLRERLAERPPLSPKAHESFLVASGLLSRAYAARGRLNQS